MGFVDKDGKEQKLQGIAIIGISTHCPEILPYQIKHSEDITMPVDQIWLCFTIPVLK
jgi:hypothetical protein